MSQNRQILGNQVEGKLFVKILGNLVVGNKVTWLPGYRVVGKPGTNLVVGKPGTLARPKPWENNCSDGSETCRHFRKL